MGVVLAPAIGPSIGGLLVDWFGWRSIFFMVVPLALSARATASVFALEGAALVWLGVRQERRLPQIAGLLFDDRRGGKTFIATLLLLGYGIGAVLVPVVLRSTQLGVGITTISTSPVIFVGSVLFALLTVLLSCSKPVGGLPMSRCQTCTTILRAMPTTAMSSPAARRRSCRSSTKARVASTVACTSASLNLVFWKSQTVRPKALRSFT